MLSIASRYFRSLTSEEKKAVAEKAGIKVAYLNNLIYDKKKRPSLSIACKLERATCGRATARQMLPDRDWDILNGSSQIQ